MQKCYFCAVFFTLSAMSAMAKEKIIVGVQNFSQYMPYSNYLEATNTYGGFNRILLDLFAKKRGYHFIYRALPVKRLYSEFLKSDKLDLKYPDNPYWSRDLKKGKDVVYSQAVVTYIDGVSVLPSRKGHGLSKLRLLGIVAGFTPFTYLKYIKEGSVQTKEIFDYARLLLLVISGRVDGAYSNISVTNFYLKQMNKKNLCVFDPSLPYSRSTRHLSSIKRPEIIKEFDNFLIENKAEIEALKVEYEVESEMIKSTPPWKG